MKVDGTPYRTIWLGADGTTVQVIDQTLLPHRFVVRDFRTMEDAEDAIRTMIVRGAPLIGATAAYGMALAMATDPSDAALARAYTLLLATRPTAVNLRWALDDMRALLAPLPPAERARGRLSRAPPRSATRTSRSAARIGEHGLGLIRELKPRDSEPAASTCSPTATPAGSPPSTGAPRWRRSTRRTMPASPSMSGSTRRGRATRAPA